MLLSRMGLVACLSISVFPRASTPQITNSTVSINSAAKPVRVMYHDVFSTAEVVSGSFATPSAGDRVGRVYEFFGSNYSWYGLNRPSEELRLVRETTDNLGLSHVRFKQVYNGLPVWSCETVIHFRPDSSIYMVGGQTIATPDLSTVPAVQLSSAEATARNFVQSRISGGSLDTESELVIHPGDGEPVLVWHITVTSPTIPGVRWRVFVDAQAGSIIDEFNDIHFDGPAIGTGPDALGMNQTFNIYDFGDSLQMVDVTRSMYTPPVDSLTGVIATWEWTGEDFIISTDPNGDSVWDDNSALASAVSAHINAGISYEYFKNTFGLESFDNAGGTITLLVHALPQENAFWNGELLGFGDGDGFEYREFSAGLDVVGHEFAHAVTEHAGGLAYRYQSGALNESYSDVFGAMIDRDDWDLGEDVVLRPPFKFRDMADPNTVDLPKHMNDFRVLPPTYDVGGVHINSSIPNHAYYLAATALDKERCEQIWYRCLTTYLTPSSGFYFWAAMIMQSTVDLYGDTGPEVVAVDNALRGVGLGPVYVAPDTLHLLSVVGDGANDTVWIHNTGFQPVTVSASGLDLNGLSVAVSGGFPASVPAHDSVALNLQYTQGAADSCGFGKHFDTLEVEIDGDPNLRMIMPISVTSGMTTGDILVKLLSSSCMNLLVFNVTRFHRLDINGSRGLLDGSMLFGLVDGEDTLVYREFAGDWKIRPGIDSVHLSPSEASFAFAMHHGRLLGNMRWRLDEESAEDCNYAIAEVEVTNVCDTALTLLPGVIGYFSINDQEFQSQVGMVEEDRMIYGINPATNEAVGIVSLTGPVRNLRAVNNYDEHLLKFGNWSPANAYKHLAATSNVVGNWTESWSGMISFGETQLQTGQSAKSFVAFIHSFQGVAGLQATLRRMQGQSCCLGSTGNLDCDSGDKADIADLTAIIDHLFIDFTPLCCPEEGDMAEEGDGVIDIADLTALIDHLFISFAPTSTCH